MFYKRKIIIYVEPIEKQTLLEINYLKVVVDNGAYFETINKKIYGLKNPYIKHNNKKVYLKNIMKNHEVKALVKKIKKLNKLKSIYPDFK